MNRMLVGIVMTVPAILAVLAGVPPVAHTVSAAAASAAQSGIRPPELSAVSRAVLPGDRPFNAALSPNGRLLAFLTGGDLAIRDLTTGEVRRLVTYTASTLDEGICNQPRQPAWSRDGVQLAYAWCFEPDRDGRRFIELRAIGADGRGERVIFPKTESTFDAVAWSPDGGNIAVSYRKPGEVTQASGPSAATFHVGLISVSRGVLQDLTAAGALPFGLAFSPDGRALAYSRSRNVFVLPLDGTGERPLFPAPATSNHRFQGWTPNGRGILFTSDRSGTTDLWRVHVENGRPIGLPARLLRDVGGFDSRRVMPNGTLYYFLGRHEAERQGDVYIVSTDPASGQVLTSPAAVSQSDGSSGNPVWSRDGRQLAFRAYSGLDHGISIVSLDTGEERRIRTTVAGPRFDWSPDNRFFLIGQGVRVDAETGAVATIMGIGGTQPRWAPDGRSVAYVGIDLIVVWDLEAGGLTVRNQRTIVDADGAVRSYAFSPDGASVGWIGRDDSGRATLKVTAVSSGATRLVANIQSPDPVDVLSWAPDGRHIVFSDTTAPTSIAATDDRQSELWRVPVAGGAPEKLGLTLDHIVYPTFSPDGRFLAFAANRQGPGGLFVIETLLPAGDLR